MTAQIIQFPIAHLSAIDRKCAGDPEFAKQVYETLDRIRVKAKLDRRDETQQWPTDRDYYLVALGRNLARGEASISDDEARRRALDFEAALAKERAITAGMTIAERRKRLVHVIQDAIANATPRDN